MDSIHFASAVVKLPRCLANQNESPGLTDILMILLPLVFIWSRAPMSYGLPTKATILVGFVFGVLTLSISGQWLGCEPKAAAADSWDSESATEGDDPRNDASRPRLREGTRLGLSVGKFSRSGQRWIFEQESVVAKPDTVGTAANNSSGAEAKPSKGGEPRQVIRYRMLENLALQRVADAIAQDPNDVLWSVTGLITEFSGENLLLLSTVLRAPAATEPVVKATTKQ
jgi:hypothetical protein